MTPVGLSEIDVASMVFWIITLAVFFGTFIGLLYFAFGYRFWRTRRK